MIGHPVELGKPDRAVLIKRGRWLEYFTIAYNSLEGVIAVVAGLIAGSIALVVAQCIPLSGPDCIDENRGLSVSARLA